LPVETHVADLRFAGFGAMVNSSIGDEPAANPAAESHIKDGIEPNARAPLRLAEGGHVGIVVDKDGFACEPAQPLAQFETSPTLNLMGATNGACSPVHWPAKTNGKRRGIRGRNQGNERRLDLPADARAAFGAVYVKSLPRADFSCVAHDDLQLRAADLDSEVIRLHPVIVMGLDTNCTNEHELNWSVGALIIYSEGHSFDEKE
jgi:hypothetical protein